MDKIVIRLCVRSNAEGVAMRQTEREAYKERLISRFILFGELSGKFMQIAAILSKVFLFLPEEKMLIENGFPVMKPRNHNGNWQP